MRSAITLKKPRPWISLGWVYSLLLFERRGQFQLNAVGITETEDGDPERRKVPHFSMLYTLLIEKGRRLVKLGAVCHAEAKVIQPDAVGAETIIGDSLARVPGWSNA